MRIAFLIACVVLVFNVNAQQVSKKLDDALSVLQNDSQMEHALIGFYVINSKTGEVVYNKNGNVGMAAASTQKVVTAVTALDLLGPDYKYTTTLATEGKIEQSTLNGNIFITGSGDPSLGSWRYNSTKEGVFKSNCINALRKAGISKVNGDIIAYNKTWETQSVPGGWIWDDLGNYYGAGVSSLNWRENQYDLKLSSGEKTGEIVKIVGTEPKLFNVNLVSELRSGKPGSGDNAYIYLAPYSTNGFVRGTIPPGQNSFTISGSMPNPGLQLAHDLANELNQLKMGQPGFNDAIGSVKNIDLPASCNTIFTHYSPSLDTLVHWYLKKSINLYGEAFIKTLGYEKKKVGSWDAGFEVLHDFWKAKGINKAALRMQDGSGLSPQNRVTPKALVQVMQYAKARPWFQAFYNGLPEINGLKMKSGTIGGAKSFTGYSGDYVFAIIINNFSGSSGEAQKKMWKVLDELK